VPTRASLSCGSMTDWSTWASLATAAGTLVLAAATFASIRSANRSARVSEFAARTAERALMANQRPLLVNSRFQDPQQKVDFYEGAKQVVDGGGADLDVRPDAIYMSASLRNVGSGLAVLHGWYMTRGRQMERVHPPLEDFTAHVRDIYIASGDIGFWLSALRDPEGGRFAVMSEAINNREDLTLYLLYGDFEGGQRVITQFALRFGDAKWRISAGRHFNVDRPEPRPVNGHPS
jgi:hypothetical protein